VTVLAGDQPYAGRLYLFYHRKAGSPVQEPNYPGEPRKIQDGPIRSQLVAAEITERIWKLREDIDRARGLLPTDTAAMIADALLLGIETGCAYGPKR
jgi:hypothetical protein